MIYPRFSLRDNINTDFAQWIKSPIRSGFQKFDELPVPLDVDRLVSRVADALDRTSEGGVRGSGREADGGSPIDLQGE